MQASVPYVCLYTVWWETCLIWQLDLEHGASETGPYKSDLFLHTPFLFGRGRRTGGRWWGIVSSSPLSACLCPFSLSLLSSLSLSLSSLYLILSVFVFLSCIFNQSGILQKFQALLPPSLLSLLSITPSSPTTTTTYFYTHFASNLSGTVSFSSLKSGSRKGKERKLGSSIRST